MSSITLETPLAESLSNSVHGKIVEQGWTQEDDTSLAEYIVLMLANGKTQDQIASELAGELLQDANGTEEFAQWLFEQVAALTGENQTTSDGAQAAPTSTTQQALDESIPAAYDMDMGDLAPDNAPRGPKGLHGGRGGARGARGGQNKGDSVLHRTRGNDRINSHMRGAPKGPRGAKDARPGMQKALNNMMAQQQQQQQPQQGQNPGQMMQNGSQSGMMPMSAQQQMEFMSMMEQQARMMAQFMPGMVQGMGNNFPQNGQQNNGSLFDRVQSGRGRGGTRGRGRGGNQSNGNSTKPEGKAGEEGQQSDVQMETDSNAPTQQSNDPSSTVCYFNLRCTNKNCSYVHQSPVAPEGVQIDMSDSCSFGAACKNPKCVGKHPSPATIKAHQAEEMCKFFPNCQNPMCPFKHPTMPLCSFGASCKNKDCRFTHLNTPCRFNPCLNPKCPYKHEEGQNKTYGDYQWTADGAKDSDSKSHVSDRKFVEDNAGEEELIKPEESEHQQQQQQQQAPEISST